MLAGNFDNAVNMGVIQAVINVFALAAVFNQLALAQGIKLMRNCRFGHYDAGWLPSLGGGG